MADKSPAEERLCARLLLDEEESGALIDAMRRGVHARPAVVASPKAPADYRPPFPCTDTSTWAWLPPRVFVPDAADCKPGATEDYARGLYYPLDLSSAWESAALAVVPVPHRSLDLCAAPGGKTMLMLARFHPGSHTANEVHPARRGILRQNLRQCGADMVEVTGLRPDQWAREETSFDLILVDAPCSGQSLLARGVPNPGCLHPSTLRGNAKRQKGILLAALKRLNPGGHLLYTTCTYDPEENEKVVSYLLKRNAGLHAVAVPALDAFRSRLSPFPSYRLLPAAGFGAGGFCCLLHLASR